MEKKLKKCFLKVVFQQLIMRNCSDILWENGKGNCAG